jgi:hypothetical protein
MTLDERMTLEEFCRRCEGKRPKLGIESMPAEPEPPGHVLALEPDEPLPKELRMFRI